MRDDVPDEIVDRHREDMLCPSAAAVTSLNVESAIWLSRWSSTDCGAINREEGSRPAFCDAAWLAPSSCMLCEPMTKLVSAASIAADMPNSSA